MATQVSRNLYQYFNLSTDITPCRGHKEARGNVVSIIEGVVDFSLVVSRQTTERYPISVGEDGITVKTSRLASSRTTYPLQAGLGVIFLKPRKGEQLELVVWGFDEEGLRQAARLLPILTGVGQPDFVVLNSECASKGAAGALAMGFFDYQWQISAGSYVT